MENIEEALKIAEDNPIDTTSFTDKALHTGGKLRCPSCGKLIETTKLEAVVTPYTQGIDRTCEDCRKALDGMCRIMCNGCREIISYVDPGKDEDGFVMERNATYHVRDCPQCNPERFEGKEVATIFGEKAAYMKREKGISMDHWL